MYEAEDDLGLVTFVELGICVLQMYAGHGPLMYLCSFKAAKLICIDVTTDTCPPYRHRSRVFVPTWFDRHALGDQNQVAATQTDAFSWL